MKASETPSRRWRQVLEPVFGVVFGVHLLGYHRLSELTRLDSTLVAWLAISVYAVSTGKAKPARGLSRARAGPFSSPNRHLLPSKLSRNSMSILQNAVDTIRGTTGVDKLLRKSPDDGEPSAGLPPARGTRGQLILSLLSRDHHGCQVTTLQGPQGRLQGHGRTGAPDHLLQGESE